MEEQVGYLKPHISINVRNVEKSVAFYRQMLGIEPAKLRTGYAKFDLQQPPLNLALNEVPKLEEAGALSHLGFQVSSTDDVLAIRERWIEKGLITRDEMGTGCCWAQQDKTWVHDPDGNEWEVFVVHHDLEEEQWKAEAAGCCVTPAATEKTDESTAEASVCCAPAADPVEAARCGCRA